MQRLIAFGDSFTYGHYLPDCDGCPSKFAWPEILGNLMNRTVVNRSDPGSSNIEILFNVLNFNFHPSDLIVIGWTFVHRDLIYNKSFFGKIFNRNEHHRISLQNNNDMSNKWAEVHSAYDRSIRSGLFIEHCDLYLRSLNIDHYHFFALDKFNIKPVWTHKPKTWIDQTVIKNKDFALDNKHPGLKSHKHAGELLYKIINEKH